MKEDSNNTIGEVFGGILKLLGKLCLMLFWLFLKCTEKLSFHLARLIRELFNKPA